MSTLMNMDPKITRWPVFIVGLALAFATFTWWSLIRAASSVSSVTDSGYYSHGLTYNSTSQELLAATARGWKITPRLSGRRLTITVEDAGHSAVPGCQGFIMAQPMSAAGQRPLPLTDAGQGRYTVDLPAGLPSPLAADLTLAKDQATLQRRLLITMER